MPVTREVLETVAVEYGVCTRPVAVRRVDQQTGESTLVDLPCGATLASKCPSCAERARLLRMAQCREGWHLDEEADFDSDEPTTAQRDLGLSLADLHSTRRGLVALGADTTDVDVAIDHAAEQLAEAGVRGSLPSEDKVRRHRSTRRRQDVPDLPRRPVASRTVGQVFEGRDGRRFRPSLFWTATLRSYGRVHADGTPVDPDTYDYRAAARDAIHFSKLADRTMQNLRRFVGWDVQYFAAVEPQKRLAPHLHVAMRGTMARKELRQVLAATYHQVWWPNCDQPVYLDVLPVWDEQAGGFVDPHTGEPLPTWDQALDALDTDPDARPAHVVRWGTQIDAQGVIAGSPEANHRIAYAAKYTTKDLAECHPPTTDAQRAHLDRLTETLRYEPCSPTCANWLRFGVQPRNARPDQQPGFCRGKAHRREHAGYGGRRVLVSRKWSGKTLADHRHDRRDWVLNLLGITDTEGDTAQTPDGTCGSPCAPATATPSRSNNGS